MSKKEEVYAWHEGHRQSAFSGLALFLVAILCLPIWLLLVLAGLINWLTQRKFAWLELLANLREDVGDFLLYHFSFEFLRS